MTALPSSKAPPIVGRPALLEHATADFLNEVTRQRPWNRSRSETLLESLDRFLGGSVPLSSYTTRSAAAWQRTLPLTEQGEATQLLADFDLYLQEWAGGRPPGRWVQ